MLIMQGGVYLAHRTVGDIQARAIRHTQLSAVVMVMLFVLAGVWVRSLDGYVIVSVVDGNALPNPLDKTVITQTGAWLHNFMTHPQTWTFPMLGVVMPLISMILLRLKHTLTAFIASSLAVLGVIMTAGVALFPFIMPSSSQPNASLTVWDGVSSHLTLMVMLYVTVLLLPLVVIYTSWAYAVMRGKVTKAYIQEQEHTLY